MKTGTQSQGRSALLDGDGHKMTNNPWSENAR
jgi:hypothetical protein